MERRLELSSGGQLFASGDYTIHQQGFNLPLQQWSLLNRFGATESYCCASKKKWNQAASDLCPCGEIKMMSHSVDSCPLTTLNGGLSQPHSADDDAWLISYGS